MRGTEIPLGTEVQVKFPRRCQWPTSNLATEENSTSPGQRDPRTHQHSRRRGRTGSQSHQDARLITPLATVHQQSWGTRPGGTQGCTRGEPRWVQGELPRGGQGQHLIPLEKRNSDQKPFCRGTWRASEGNSPTAWGRSPTNPTPDAFGVREPSTLPSCWTRTWTPKLDKHHEKVTNIPRERKHVKS